MSGGIPGSSLALTALEAGAVGLLQQLRGSTPRGMQWTPTDPTTDGPLLDVDGNPVVNSLMAQVTMEEDHDDELYITQHPVEQGASISDHAFKLPARLRMRLGWSDSPSPKNTGLLFVPANIISGLASTAQLFSVSPSYVRSIYAVLLALQESRVPITIFTGKRTYDNMLLHRVGTETKADTEHSLIVRIEAEQIIIVNTQVVLIPTQAVHSPAKSAQAKPAETTPVTDNGTVQPKSVTNLSPDQMGDVCPATDGTDWVNANPTPVTATLGNTITGAL